MSDYICYVNGEFTPYSQASLPLNDLSILRGYGVFDALRTYHGKPFHLEAHLQRLTKSAGLIGITLPWSVAEMEAIVRETLRRNALDEATVRIQVTGGPSNDAITPLEQPRLLVMVSALRFYSAEIYEKGIKVITVRIERPLPTAKTIDYTPAILALAQARARNAM
ncbi:MAG: aminotransferase class IV, partial [Anaerolineae bacterium]